MLTRRKFLQGATSMLALAGPVGAALAAETAAAPQPPKIGRSTRAMKTPGEAVASVRLPREESFKILQFTDLHLFNKSEKEDEHTFADIQKQVERQHPDLIVISGDLWHDNDENRSRRARAKLEPLMAKFQTPWTMIWGNHDLSDDYQEAHDHFASMPHSVYRGAVTHGDYRIELTNAAGGRAFDVFFLNSNNEGLGAWQVAAWREMEKAARAELPKPAPAIVFTHVPLKDYETRQTVTNLKGTKFESVGCYKEQGDACAAFLESGRVKAVFCGHNHTNDYVVQAKGIDLIYSRSTGYAGYGGDLLRKGAKLIELNPAKGEYKQKSVFADGTEQIA